MVTQIKTASEIKSMREGGKILATVLSVMQYHVQAGMSTQDMADRAALELKALGGQPTFLGYQGFPDIICISINQEVVHGIPSRTKIIKEGDLIGFDFGVTFQGMVTDSAMSLIVGKPKQKGHVDLLKNTEAALHVGIASLHDQVRTGDIGHAIEKFLKHHRYGIVRDLVGHGVGHEMHEDPNIPNYGRANTGPWLSAGMTIAIEPMVTLGTDRVLVADDDWTIVTADNSWAAHFEHTVLITQDGAEILTQL